MDSKSQTRQIFNHDLRTLRRSRAIQRYESGKGEAFLLGRAGEIAAEKIQDINRQFGRTAVIGLPAFMDRFLDNLPDERRPVHIDRYHDWPENFPDASYEMIISGLVLQSRNDVPELIVSARRALRPDGFFLSVLLGGESLLGLRRACFALDQAERGGVIPRIAPMIDLQQAGGLLAMAGLAQPVIDRDYIKVNYGSLQTLVEDLRDIGETNCLNETGTGYSGRNYMTALEAHYPERSEDKKFSVLFDLIWLSGWAPHESQQKPLKPGSAKTRLSDALRSLRET